MNEDELDRMLRTVSRRRPFRPYVIEFVSGDRLLVAHPELVRRSGELYLYLGRGGDYRLFAASSVSHILPPEPPPASGAR